MVVMIAIGIVLVGCAVVGVACTWWAFTDDVSDVCDVVLPVVGAFTFGSLAVICLFELAWRLDAYFGT